MTLAASAEGYFAKRDPEACIDCTDQAVSEAAMENTADDDLNATLTASRRLARAVVAELEMVFLNSGEQEYRAALHRVNNRLRLPASEAESNAPTLQELDVWDSVARRLAALPFASSGSVEDGDE